MKEKLTHFKVGQIVNTQGLKGEVRVYPLTDDIERFDELKDKIQRFYSYNEDKRHRQHRESRKTKK